MIRGLRFTIKGGPGSGHHGHGGIPGQVGGSAPGGRGSLAAPKSSWSERPQGIEGSVKAEAYLSVQSGAVGGWKSATPEERAALKAQVARDLAKETGVSEEEVSEFVQQWAHSSNDDDMRSLAIQQDAADEFGVELSEFTNSKIKRVASSERLRQQLLSEDVKLPGSDYDYESRLKPLLDSSTQRKVLRAMYNKTQSELKTRGITEVRAYRGVKLPVDTFGELDFGRVPVQIKTNALTSWSLSRGVAQNFAETHGAKEGWVFTSVIPASRILSLPTTGFGCLTEGELIILGGKNDWAEVGEE